MSVKGLRHVVIYEDERFFSAFPSIIRRADGELLVAFRRAPERRWYGGRCAHADPNSQLVLVRSRDDGTTWSREPELIHAHAMGGSQDPCLSLLPDGTILCASYLWILHHTIGGESKDIDLTTGWQFSFAGGYLVRSRDGGRHWEGPIIPPPVPGDAGTDALGRPLPGYTRGNLLVGRDGKLYRAVVRREKGPQPGVRGPTSVHLMVSSDGGDSWEYRCPIAMHETIGFNETFLYETEGGDLVAFVRTAGGGDAAPNAIARSRDGGRSFEPWQALNFRGHPHGAARLPDGRVLLVYGYRVPPYGIRARVLDAECRDVVGAEEIVLRDDGGSPDLGYAWPLVFPDGRVLVVYYFNRAGDPGPTPPAHLASTSPTLQQGMTAGGGIRHIAGTWMEF